MLKIITKTLDIEKKCGMNLIMLNKCVMYNGKYYYWNPKKGKVREVVFRDVELSSCPAPLLQQLLGVERKPKPEKQLCCPHKQWHTKPCAVFPFICHPQLCKSHICSSRESHKPYKRLKFFNEPILPDELDEGDD